LGPFFNSRFLGASWQGELQNATKTFYKEVENSVHKKSRKTQCQFPLDVLYLGLSCFDALPGKGSKKTPLKLSFYKEVRQKVPTFFLTKSPMPIFLDVILSRFSAFLGEGSSKTPGAGACKSSCASWGDWAPELLAHIGI
jgi:hypothetical protein